MESKQYNGVGGRREFLRRGLFGAVAIGLPMLSFPNPVKDLLPIVPSLPGDSLQSLKYATEWLNSMPLSEKDLRGKLVVIDFCTYSCINWLRTVPYTKAWNEKYSKYGLVTIGVHTPEFEFEKRGENISSNLAALKIDYPIAVDNDRRIWDGFDNNYWPARYIIDGKGQTRFTHFGEGNYSGSEEIIRRLLEESGVHDLEPMTVGIVGTGIYQAADTDNLQSPENYLGANRTEGFASREAILANRRRTYSPSALKARQWSLSAAWTFNSESVISQDSNSLINFAFHARDANIVMGADAGKAIHFKVKLDGKTPGKAAGQDIGPSGDGVLQGHKMYQLIRQPGIIEDSVLEISFANPGAELFSLTFG